MRISSTLSIAALLAFTSVVALGDSDTKKLIAQGQGTITSSGAPNCQFSSTGCTIVYSGTIQGGHIGNANFDTTLTIDWAAHTSNGSGGFCAPANGTTVIATHWGNINIAESGTVCEVGTTGANVPHTFNGTYTITGGTGRFSGATGAGTAQGSDDGAGNVLVQLMGTLAF